jgi:hypothetical protein
MSGPRLHDPFYGQLVGSIAITTALVDSQAQEAGLAFTDSQVRAVFHRAILTLQGKPPKAKKPTSEKERLQGKLYEDLIQLRTTIVITHRETKEKEMLPVSMFLKAMRTAKKALEDGRTGEPGERTYLERAHAMLQRVESTDAAEVEDAQEASPDEDSSEER